MRKLAWIAPLLWSAIALADKPAAVQVCLQLPSGVELFSDSGGRNYRSMPDGTYVLDLELTFSGKEPQHVARASARCLRAYVPAATVSEISVGFARTDLNLRPQARQVKLNLKPDLWYDGGSLEIAKAPFSKITTALGGTIGLQRLETGEWAKGPLAVKDLEKVPAGRYRIVYDPPVEQATCDIGLRVSATGTVREDTHPKELASLVEAYRRQIAPEVARALKVSCDQGQSLEMAVDIVDGVYWHPWSPRVERVTHFDQLRRYELVMDGERSRFVSGEEVEIGFGQAIALEVRPDSRVATR